MKYILLATFLPLLQTFVTASPPKNQCYRAAVLENIQAGNNKDLDPENPLEYINQNLAAYDEAAARARNEKAQILITSEEGLFGAQTVKGHPEIRGRDSLKMVVEDIPDPKDGEFIPCIDSAFDKKPILHELSCIARRHKIYLVANHGDIKNCTGQESCRKDGVWMFNTQIAFDRSGKLIGRYHKMHLFGEFHFDQPLTQDFSFFDTDFGVRFGMYICFDRLFRDPMIGLINDYNVTTMALSTWFFDEHPFYLSHQIDQSWAQRLKINILSANVKHTVSGTTGSGLFTPSSFAIYEHDVKVNSPRSESIVLVASLPVDPKSGDQCDSNPQRIKLSHFRKEPADSYTYFKTNLTPYKMKILTDKTGRDIELCDGEFCCQLDYTLTKKPKEDYVNQYVFAVVKRMRTGYYTSNYTTGEENCFVSAYDTRVRQLAFDTRGKFDKLRISGNFSTDYVYKSALTNKFNLIQNKKLVYGDNTLEVKSKKPILFAGMHGRCYDEDPPYVQADYGDRKVHRILDPINGPINAVW
jgi:hypothetical protein